MSSRPQKTPMPNSQVAQEVLEQTKMISQDAHKNVVQDYINDRTDYDKKAKAPKLSKLEARCR